MSTHGIDRAGHVCKIASNGQEALAEYEAGGCDLIFMDCRMPLLDGFEATKKIRELEAAQPTSDLETVKHIPIIGLTADVMHGTNEKCLQASFHY